MKTTDARDLVPSNKPQPERRGGTPPRSPVHETRLAKPLGASLDEAVAHINAIFDRKGMEVVLEVGRFVLDRFFEGNPLLLADRGKRHPSFRALAGRGDLQMSHTWLWRAVRIYVQLPLLPAEAATRLSRTHHALLLPVRSRLTKYELAERAIEEQMSSREFEVAVQEALWLEGSVKGKRRRIGRRPVPTFLKTVRKLGELAEQEGRWHDLNRIDQLRPEDALALGETLSRVERKCEEVRGALRSARSGSSDP